MSALKHSPVLLRVVCSLCESAQSAITGELARHSSRVRSEAFRDAIELVSSWAKNRANRQTIDNILMELEMRVRAEAEAAKP